MRKIRKDIAWIAAAFLALCAISAYRQIGMRFSPGDAVWPIVVCLVYVLLLGIWWAAVRVRVMQNSMRTFLLAEQILMLLSVTGRYVLERVFSHDVYLLRVSGYWICLPMVLIPLFGLYASFGLGKAEEYRMNRRWYYLLIPAAALIILMVTNESHHLMFRTLEGEVTPNLTYHPNHGLYAIIAWALSLIVVRIFLIFRRGRESRGYARARFLPFAFAVSILAPSAYYFGLSYAVEYELIEYMVLMFFLEVMVWESCILVGMVPVNTNYAEVFDRSTIAMQIVDEGGLPELTSIAAPVLTSELFDRLKKQTSIRTSGGKELNIHKISGGYAVWQNDISKTLSVIDELRRSAEKLEHESELLSQELKTQSEEVSVREQNRIYDRLTKEVGEQLSLMQSLLEKRDWAEDKASLFKKICLIGTYVKRRCNLRLIEQADGQISNKELELCFNELVSCLIQIGVEAKAHWDTSAVFSPEFAIHTLDVFEFLVERERFDMHQIEVKLEPDSAFSVLVYPDGRSPICPQVQELQRISGEDYSTSTQLFEESYCLTVSERRS